MAESRTGSDTGRERPAARPGQVLATVCLCQLLVVLDISVVNVALPEIGQDLGFAPCGLSWVVNAHTLVFGGLLLLGGRIAVLGSFAASRLVGRVDGRLLTGGGLALGGVGMLWFGMLRPDSTFLGGFLGPSLVASVGIGLSVMANTAMGTSRVASDEAGLVSGLLNASRQCGGSIGLAALSTVAVTVTDNAATADPVAALADGYARAFSCVGAGVLAASLLAVLLVPRLTVPRNQDQNV